MNGGCREPWEWYGQAAVGGPTLLVRAHPVANRCEGRIGDGLAGIPAGVETELLAATSLGDVIDRARRRSFSGRRSGHPTAGRPSGADREPLAVPRDPATESLVEPPTPLPPVTIPAMGVWSSGDFALVEDGMTGSARYVTGPWRYERVDGAGHWLQLDAPDKVNALLLDFLGQQGEVAPAACLALAGSVDALRDVHTGISDACRKEIPVKLPADPGIAAIVLNEHVPFHARDPKPCSVQEWPRRPCWPPE